MDDPVIDTYYWKIKMQHNGQITYLQSGARLFKQHIPSMKNCCFDEKHMFSHQADINPNKKGMKRHSPDIHFFGGVVGVETGVEEEAMGAGRKEESTVEQQANLSENHDYLS